MCMRLFACMMARASPATDTMPTPPCSGLSRLLPASPYAPGLCLGFCSSGFLSPASGFDTCSTLGHGKCSTHDRRRFPSFMRVSTGGSNFPCICVSGSSPPFRLFHEPSMARTPHSPRSTAQVQANYSTVALAPALSTAHQLTLSPSHITIASSHLGNATSRVAVTAAAVIAITTVVTSTKAPCSDGLHILNDLLLATISPSVPAIPSSCSSPSPQ